MAYNNFLKRPPKEPANNIPGSTLDTLQKQSKKLIDSLWVSRTLRVGFAF